MKVKLAFYYNNKETEHIFNAEFKDQRFYFEDSTPFVSDEVPVQKRRLLIEDYRISDQLNREIGYDVNTHFKTSFFSRTINVYSKFNWFQKQRIKFILEDHYFQQEGNFKWLIGGIFSILAFIITFNITNQSNEIDILKKEQLQLRDSIGMVKANLHNEQILNEENIKKPIAKEQQLKPTKPLPNK